jgi:hypothetical protein
MIKEHKRNCPSCNKVLYYTRNFSKISADRTNSKCFSCCNGGKNNPMFGTVSPRGMLGKHHSLQSRLQSSQKQRGIPHSKEQNLKTSITTKEAMKRPDVKKRLYDSLSKTKYLKVKTDKGQLELLEKWNRLGFNFEPNYQLYNNDFLCYIDGYDTQKNVVIEYDSTYHRQPYQQTKDLIRQHQIVNILKPKKFWRYNSTTKQFKDVL